MGEGLGQGGLLVLGLKGTGTPTEKAPPDCSTHMSDDPPHQGLAQVPSDCWQTAPPPPCLTELWEWMMPLQMHLAGKCSNDGLVAKV